MAAHGKGLNFPHTVQMPGINVMEDYVEFRNVDFISFSNFLKQSSVTLKHL